MLRAADTAAEIVGVAAWLRRAVADGIAPAEAGVFVRSRAELDRARAAVTRAGLEPFDLSERDEAPGGRTPVGTMHLAKGLEFKAVAVMACDDDVLPLRARVGGWRTRWSWTRCTVSVS